MERVRFSRRTVLGAAAVAPAILIAGAPGRAGAVLDSGPKGSSDTIVVRWNQHLLEAIRGGTMGPPMIGRALGMMHTAIYDAWAAYDPVAHGTIYGGELRRPASEHTVANKSAALSHAAYRVAVDLFPGSKTMFDRFMRSLGYDPGAAPADSSPAGIGVKCADGLLRYRHSDGSNQLGDLHPGPYSDYTGYQPVNDPMTVTEPIDPATVHDPNRWQPLTYTDTSGRTITPTFLGAHWTKVKPFALPYSSIFRSRVAPAQYGTRAYADQAAEVIAYSAGLTDRQKVIAEYWADGPASEQPPGHWQLFAAYVSRRDRHTLDQDVKLFFATTNAVFDAGVAAWDDKRHFDYVRPITAIRLLYRGQQIRAWGGVGQGTQSIDGGTWQPYQPPWFPTPPFAEYVSG
ncbi:MAG: DUF6851 domain-containing protein, partial [Micromonosporaceae bacterium]